MVFVITDDLKPGMRLAKPIYNKNGVLLYDRDSKLSLPAINSIKNFGLIGIYILEPAEPLPPLSREDILFEQLQTVYIFRLREIMDNILKRGKIDILPGLIEDILKHYATLDHRVNFNQNLRSPEDFLYKHAISTAILVTMMSSHLGFSRQKQYILITAALLYGIGFRYVPRGIIDKGSEIDMTEREMIGKSLEKGLDFVSNYRGEYDFFSRALALMQVFVNETYNPMHTLRPDEELASMRNLLRVADTFDHSTAMNIGHCPESEIKAIQFLQSDPLSFHPDYVSSLAQCIHIVPGAASVDFTDGSKGIVLVENPVDFMHPVVLRFGDNQIYDLSTPEAQRKLTIKDIMKTLDNRIVMDEQTVKQFVPDEHLRSMTAEIRARLAK